MVHPTEHHDRSSVPEGINGPTGSLGPLLEYFNQLIGKSWVVPEHQGN